MTGPQFTKYTPLFERLEPYGFSFDGMLWKLERKLDGGKMTLHVSVGRDGCLDTKVPSCQIFSTSASS